MFKHRPEYASCVPHEIKASLLAGDGCAVRTAGKRMHHDGCRCTRAACLMTEPDASCRAVLSQLDQVRRESPLFDLLHAHRSAPR